MHLRRWLLGALAASLLVAACGGDEPSVPATGGVSLPSSPTELPDYDLDAYDALLQELRGTPVVVNVWASWCGPCRDEAPALASAAAEYGDRVRFVGIDVLDAKPDARAFIEEYGWPYPSIFDQTGAIRDALGLVGQPGTVFYDDEGNVVQTHTGAIAPDELAEQLDALLAA